MIELSQLFERFPSMLNSVFFIFTVNPLIISILTTIIVLIIITVNSSKPSAKAAIYTFFAIFGMNILNFYCEKFLKNEKENNKNIKKMFNIGAGENFIDKYKPKIPFEKNPVNKDEIQKLETLEQKN